MDELLSGEENILNSGYAGTTVLSIKLDTLGSESSRRKREAAAEVNTNSTANETVPKECKVGVCVCVCAHTNTILELHTNYYIIV